MKFGENFSNDCKRIHERIFYTNEISWNTIEIVKEIIFTGIYILEW